jgi:TPR repeat protein
MCLLTGKVLQSDLPNAIKYFKMSGDKETSERQVIVGWMTKNGIGTRMDLIEAVRYYNLSSDQSPDGADLLGRCYQIGRGISVDFILAAEYFQKAADLNNGADANSFSCFLEKRKTLTKTLIGQHLNSILLDFTTLVVVLNMANGLNKISFEQQNIITYRLN